MKQTAVQWLINEFKENDWWYLPQSMKEDIIQQAKEMEKEQIKEAWLNSLTKGDYNSAEQYYTETYESNN